MTEYTQKFCSCGKVAVCYCQEINKYYCKECGEFFKNATGAVINAWNRLAKDLKNNPPKNIKGKV